MSESETFISGGAIPITLELKDASSQRSDWVSFGAWWVLLLSGYLYVAGVLCQRDNALYSGNAGIVEFVLVAVLSPLFFALGPRHNWNPPGNSAWTILKWNGASYLLPFFLMLHWEFVGHAIGAHFSLKAADLNSLDARSLAALLVAFALIAGLLACHLAWAHRTGILRPYMIVLFVIPGMVAIITLILRDTHYVHIHHYCLGAFLFPFFRFRNATSLMAQAAFAGLAVEGISRWGMDPMWYPLVP